MRTITSWVDENLRKLTDVARSSELSIGETFIINREALLRTAQAKLVEPVLALALLIERISDLDPGYASGEAALHLPAKLSASGRANELIEAATIKDTAP